MSVNSVKLEPDADAAESAAASATDEMMFGTLQARVESLKSELSVISKNRNQVMRRLKKKMNEENLDEIRCGSFVLVRSEQEQQSDDEEPEIAFDRERLAEHFSEDAVESYCNNPNNHKRKRRKQATFRVERHVVEVSDS